MAQEEENQQSNTNTKLNRPIIGMNLDSSPIDLGEQEYSLGLNLNLQSADGNLLKITNESSNLLCSRFKPGYFPIGKPLYIPTQKLTIFFLVNPTTHSSEIGYIKNVVYDDSRDIQVNCQDCNNPLEEETPLEQRVQTAGCFYQTIVNADCLNFNINYPIDSVYEIGVNVDTQLPDCDNITIFFTDFLNPRRYLNINNWPQQIIGHQNNDCHLPIYNGLLDCNAIKVAPDYTNGCVISTQITTGGSNKAGAYQFGAAYAHVTGEPISDYFTISNPVSLYDPQRTVTVNTDYVTGQAIKVNIGNIDTQFLYLKLVVLKTINNVTTVNQVGIFPINSDTFTYNYTGNNSAKEPVVSINEILARKTHYPLAKDIAKANDILFWVNLNEQRIINLQPVVNNLTLKWQTIEVGEGFYANGVNAANYQSFERDEVYPFGIEFRKSNGYKLPTFLISAPASGYFQTQYGIDVKEILPDSNPDVLIDPNCCIAPTGTKTTQLFTCYPSPTLYVEGTIVSPTVNSQDYYAHSCNLSQIPTIFNPAICENNSCLNTILEGLSNPTILSTTSKVIAGNTVTCTNGLKWTEVKLECNVLIEYGPNPVNPCSLNQLWQVYNTAQNRGIGCSYISPSTGSGTITQTEYCSSLYTVCPSGGCESTSYPTIPPTCPACSPVGATNCQPVGPPIKISDVVTTSTPTYPKTVTIFQPNWNADIITPYNIQGCTDPVNCLQTVNPYVTSNNTALQAYSLLASTNTNCSIDPNNTSSSVGNQSGKPVVFFQYSSATTPTIENPNGVFQNAVNQTWYSFTAVNTTQAITVSPFAPVPVTIVVYSDLGHTIVTPYSFESGPKGGYTVLTNLTIGTTYYFVVFTPNPTFSDSTTPYTGIQWNWGTICINVPASIGTETTTYPEVWQQTFSYETSDSATVLNSANCAIQTYQYGDFAYWESTSLYPNNPDVWGELCGKPIRHHKFPDCIISNIHNGPLVSPYGTKNKIYPIGVRIDINDVKNILNQAVTLGLISEQEKEEITGFSIKRGNRRGNRSVVAKGLLNDVWSTPQLQLNIKKNGATWDPVIKNGVSQLEYYPNYFFNDSEDDNFILNKEGGVYISHPYKSQGKINGRYTFHSPNTSFNQPFLTTGQELKLETVEYGGVKGTMNEVLYHSKYVLLTKDAYGLAEALAGIEIFFDATVASLNAGGTAFSWAYIGVYFALTLTSDFLLNQGKYTSQWAEIFQKLGTPQNPVIYYTGVGIYNNYIPVPNGGASRKRASINNSRYILPGNFQFEENSATIKFNNFQRESSVYLSTDAFDNSNNIILNKAFQNTSVFGQTDTSRQDFYNTFSNNCSLNTDVAGNIASYYASIKNYVPDQYGTPDQIEWIDTGYCGIINWKDSSQSTICDTIFGGDTFINRFAYKEKIALFTDQRVANQTTSVQTDIFYKDLGNVGFPRYYFNSMYDNVKGSAGSAFFGFTPPDANFICGNNTFFYQRGKMPLYFYSIPYFICESDYNVDLRHAEDSLAKNFYPYVGDIVNWTQQYQIPIYYDNYYFYNSNYSKQNFENFAYILKNNFTNLSDACQTKHPTRIIWSPQGTQFWLNYLSADYYDFAREDGDLINLIELEENKILVRQTQGNKIFNAFAQLNTNQSTVQIQAVDIFKNNKPSQVYKTDLGFGGSYHVAIESTPHGTFYVNTENPEILKVERSMYGRSTTSDVLEPREGKSKAKLWARQNFPFNITKDYPEVNIDNVYKYFGIATTWDNKFDRLFITKRDAKVKQEYKNLIKYNSGDGEFYLDGKIVLPTDEKYFQNKSWTITYNPVLGEFISFMSFTPNYYISTEGYYQSGINFPNSGDSTEIGLWTHNLTERSYQVFYGKLQPFLFEYVIKDTIKSTILNNVSYQAEFQRYQDDLNWYKKNDVTFNSAIVFNQNQTTGKLNLIPVEKDNLLQLISYPKFNVDSRDILVENVQNFYSFNNFNNISRLNGQPMFIYKDGKPTYKVENPLASNYSQTFFPSLMKSDYFSVRLENSIYSNYKIIFKHGISPETDSI